MPGRLTAGALLAAALASGCSCNLSHSVDPDGGRDERDGEVAVEPPPPSRTCLTEDAVTIDIGPDAECTSAEVPLLADVECSLGPGRPARGAGVRFFRRAPGAVYLRVTGCSRLAYDISRIDCAYCTIGSSDDLAGVSRLPPFPDDGLLERIYRPTDESCERMEIEVCFDPEYGPSPFDP